MRESVKYFLEIGQTYSPNDTASWIEAIEFLEKNYEDQLKKLQSKKENTLKELRLEKYYARITSLYNQIK
jgi:glycosyltransferase involved in cell wall biosynthesis